MKRFTSPPTRDDRARPVPATPGAPHRSGGRQGRRHQGFTLVELVASVAILVLITTLGLLNVRPLDNSLGGGAALITTALQEAREEAVATTSGVRVDVTAGTLVFTSAPNCNPATASTGLAKTQSPVLPQGARLTGDTGTLPFNVCFSPRGDVNRAARLTYANRTSKTRTINIFLAGGVNSE